MTERQAIFPAAIAELRNRYLVAKAAHMAIREVLDRDHPDRIKSKEALESAYETWHEVVHSN